MKKYNQLLSVFLFALAASSPLSAQENTSGIRVIVHPLKVESTNEQIKLAAEAMRSTIELSLTLVQEFNLISPKDEAALSKEVDRSVDGRCYTNSKEEIIFELTVHDLKLKKSLFNQSYKAETLFDLFDVSDKATVSLLEALTKKQVRFGSLKVTGRDPNEPFDIFLNGEKVASGRGAVSKDNIIAGTYELQIKQFRPWGQSTIYKETVDISPDNVSTIELSENYLMETERDKLLLPPPSKEHGLFTATDTIYRSASGVYDAADFLPDKAQKAYAEITRTMHDDTLYFPAKDAFDKYLQNLKLKYQESAHALIAADKNSHTYLPTRTMHIDGHKNDWEGIPKIEVAPNTRYVEMHKQKVVPIETPHRKTFQTLYSDSVETLQSLGGWHNKGASAGALRRIHNSFQMITD